MLETRANARSEAEWQFAEIFIANFSVLCYSMAAACCLPKGGL